MPTTRSAIREASRAAHRPDAAAPPPAPSTGPAPPRPRPAPPGIGLAGGMLAAGAFLVAVWLVARPGAARPTAPATPVAVADAAGRLGGGAAAAADARPSAPDGTPDPCAGTAPLLRLVADQQGQGKYLLAASNAETGLAQPDLCPAHREQLARQAVLGRLQALWSESIRPDDREAQQRALELYRETVGLADRYGVSTVRPSAQVAADRAYQSGQFLLAKRVLDDLLASNPAAADRALLRRYYATMRNLGVALAGGASADARDEGVSLLVAAYLVDERYRLEQGEATRDLVALVGPDRAHWPAPAASPLLAPSDRPRV